MDLSFTTLDLEATDSPTIIQQKAGVSLRGVVTAALSYNPGGGGDTPAGAEFDTDSNAPVFDTDSNQVTVSTD